MKTIRLKLGKRSYPIVICHNNTRLLGKLLKSLVIGNNAYIIAVKYIGTKYSPFLQQTLRKNGIESILRIIPDTEKSKSLAQAYRIVKDISRQSLKKEIFIIALGGGVVGDLAGFVASIYKRGIPYIHVPTTLLAQVDSSIGGKTAVDLNQGKNLVGAFYQPRLVFSDTIFLKTLPLRQIRSGLSEIIKYGIIKDPVLFRYLEENYQKILALSPAALEFIISRCSAIKAGVVSQDEREDKGVRTILNFGHTIGHAVEAAGHFKRYTHGEAIALGMLVATRLSQELHFIDKTVTERIESLIKAVGLPYQIKDTRLQAIIKAHYYDKKFTGRKNKFVLITALGKTKIIDNIPLRVIKQALEETM